MDITHATNHERWVIYQARRGLKELDYYIDPYVKGHYLSAPVDEKAAFERLLAYEDPDLLEFFLGQNVPDDAEVTVLINKLKRQRHA